MLKGSRVPGSRLEFVAYGLLPGSGFRVCGGQWFRIWRLCASQF